MDHGTLDGLTARVRRLISRRAAISGLGALTVPSWADARKKRKRKNKRKNKRRVTFNDFGCVNVDGFCQSSAQCCSGICEGKKGKQTCRAHDQSTCQAGQVEGGCGGESVTCTTSTGIDGACDTTTGNAGYCRASLALLCYPCGTDADCVPVCGPQAACIDCAVCENDGDTACAGLVVGGCDFPAES